MTLSGSPVRVPPVVLHGIAHTLSRLFSVVFGASHQNSEGVSTAVWSVPGFGAGFAIALEPSKLQKKEKSWKRTLIFSAPNSGMHQTLVQKSSEK